MLSPSLAVMEIKVNERIPYWLTEIIAAHDLQLVRVSKYCRSIDAAQSRPFPAWRSAATERARGATPSSFPALSALGREMGIRRQEKEVSRGYL
jgi:hypothetical protein